MTAGDEGLLRNVTREVLAELLPGLLEEALATPAGGGNGNGHRAEPPEPAPAPAEGAIPQVPAPPIAKVHRPTGWRPPDEETPSAAPATASTEPAPSSAAAANVTVESIELRTDADLDAFVRSLARRLENPRDRMAILSGRLRFGLRAGAVPQAAAPPTVPAHHVEKGAVTERHVREAAAAGARLVLAPRAVLTPMARDRARSLGVEIEKERRC
jgi:hypothetical protein